MQGIHSQRAGVVALARQMRDHTGNARRLLPGLHRFLGRPPCSNSGCFLQDSSTRYDMASNFGRWVYDHDLLECVPVTEACSDLFCGAAERMWASCLCTMWRVVSCDVQRFCCCKATGQCRLQHAVQMPIRPENAY